MAYLVGGCIVFLPVPLLVAVFILPGVIWLALFGLAVPAVLVEKRRRARRRCGAGCSWRGPTSCTSPGALATLALVVIISQFSLYFVLREYADNTRMIAAALASLVVSPASSSSAARFSTSTRRLGYARGAIDRKE